MKLVGGQLQTFRELMRAQPCSYCQAPAGAPCRSRSGQRATYDHAPRYYLAREIWLHR